MITTRFANSSDLDWIFAECVAFSKAYEAKFSLAGNEAYGRSFISNLIENHLLLIGLKDGERAGFIGGLITPHHFNPDIKQLAELFWWVPEKFRGTAVGGKLFLEFVAFGKQHCDCITMTVENHTPITDESLAKRGFKLTEKAYLMECN
jgi:RimJ/RimL family protein N-acetyltransferase